MFSKALLGFSVHDNQPSMTAHYKPTRCRQHEFDDPLDPAVEDVFRVAGCGYLGIGVAASKEVNPYPYPYTLESSQSRGTNTLVANTPYNCRVRTPKTKAVRGNSQPSPENRNNGTLLLIIFNAALASRLMEI